MAYLELRPHVSYGLVGDRPVFLDLARDRYLMLPPPVERAFSQARARGDSVLPAGADGELLLGTGLFGAGSLRGAGLKPSSVTPCSASLLDDAALPRAGLPAILRAAACVVRARQHLARRSLREIVEAIRERRQRTPPTGKAAATENAARRFLAARALVPGERRCLPECLALLDWLGAEAPHATLVFGVRLDPFAAHCWLQTDHRLLTDAADELGAFVPVLAV